MMIKNTKTLINNRKQGLLLFLVLIFFANCARQIAPTGGDKDRLPPQVVESQPENQSTNFNKQKFQITFDEYIQLKGVNQELLISPPIIEKPEIILKGKTMQVKFEDELPDSTTINFNFHNAIADYNEGNIYENFQYVISTGNEIDTLFVVGNIRNAFNHEPIDGTYIMFYENHEDSVPQTIMPSFICKSDEGGMFRFNNIPQGEYKIFALTDANYNKLFDLPTESIAFLDTLIEPQVELMVIYDTVRLDTIIIDSLYRDTIITSYEVISSIDSIQLFMFEESNHIQYLVESKRLEDGKKLSFVFNEGLIEDLEINPINFSPEKDWYLMLENSGKDSIEYWISDTSLVSKDTLEFDIAYFIYDSLGDAVITHDTLNLIFEKKEKKKERGGLLRRNKEEEDTIVISELRLPTSIKRRILELEKNLIIYPRYPILKTEKSKIYLYELDDTIEIPVKFEFYKDSTALMTYNIRFPFEEDNVYKLLVDTAAFQDMYGNKNDTLISLFSIRESNYYGNILLNIKGLESSSVLQFMNEKEAVGKEFTVDSVNNEINMRLVHPGKYMLKLYVDENKNLTWDTGNYSTKLQPEKVYYFNEIITIKSGWDNEIEWDLKQTPLKQFNNKKKKKGKRGR